MEIVVYAFFLALFLSTALLPVLVRFAPKLGLLDYPDQRKHHQKPIPRIGGIAITVGIIVSSTIWLPMRADIQAYLFAIGILGGIMIFDDRNGLDYKIKFTVQIIVSIVFISLSGVTISQFPFIPGGVLPDWIALALTVLFLVGVTNAINLSDGLDGLAGGSTILIASCLGILSYQCADYTLMVLALIIIGATLGFLRYNTHPAWVYMGDTGSQCLGFSMAAISVIVTQNSNPALSPVLPLLILGLPIFDAVAVMIRRKMAGQPIFTADRRHLHHQLIGFGLTFYEAVTLIYSVQILLIVLSYYFAYSSDILLLVIYVVFCTVLLGVISLLRYYKTTYNIKFTARNRFLQKGVYYLKKTGATTKAPRAVLQYVLPILYVLVSLVVEHVNYEFGFIALILAIILMISLYVKQRRLRSLTRFIIYFFAAIEVYLLSTSYELMAHCSDCILVVYAILAITTAVWIRYSGKHFKFTSLDFLVIFTLIMVPHFELLHENKIDLMVIEIMILFYASEVVISENIQKWTALHSGVLTALIVLCLRGLVL